MLSSDKDLKSQDATASDAEDKLPDESHTGDVMSSATTLRSSVTSKSAAASRTPPGPQPASVSCVAHMHQQLLQGGPAKVRPTYIFDGNI